MSHLINIDDDIHDLVYKSTFIVNFNNEILTESCIKITNKYITFNMYSVKGEVPVLSTVSKLIRNNSSFNISIDIYDKVGFILYRIFLDNVTFIKIKNLIDYSYDDLKLVKLKVRYTYKEKTLISSESELRLFKLKNISKNYML